MERNSIFEIYNGCKRTLEAAGIEDYVFESKQIIKRVTGYTSSEILTNYAQCLSPMQKDMFDEIVKQRISGYPLQYIFGEWSFYGYNFKVGPAVLIPRADTEILVDKAIELLQDKKDAKVLDLCSGSGCIGIAIALKCRDTQVVLAEKYSEAVEYIEKNKELNGVNNAVTVCGDIFESVAADGKYDLIVSNPPYLSADDMDNLQKEVTFEPDTALYGGEDGLLFYRAITENYKNSLKQGGVLAFETGIGQAKAVKQILEQSGFCDIGIKKDLNGIERVVFGLMRIN